MKVFEAIVQAVAVDVIDFHSGWYINTMKLHDQIVHPGPSVSFLRIRGAFVFPCSAEIEIQLVWPIR